MKFPKACIVVFAREPIAGKVKTRLIPALGAEGAKQVHLQLISKIFDLIDHNPLCPAQLWVDNNPLHPSFEAFKGEHKVQSGDDLGQRMLNAAAEVLKDYSSVVLIGSDCPQLDERYLEQALQALEKKNIQAVFGPATDGGYVLIGMKKIIPQIFELIDWGSDKVMQQTRERLQANNIAWHELSALSDIDRPEDLKLL
jgi:uncharacterized protein